VLVWSVVLGFNNWNDYKEGDIIEVYRVLKITPKLE
jgi:hypothetical protein